MVDVVSVLLRSLKHLARWQRPGPGPGLLLGLLRPAVVQVVTVGLRAPLGAWDTVQGVLVPCQGLGTYGKTGGGVASWIPRRPPNAPCPGRCLP